LNGGLALTPDTLRVVMEWQIRDPMGYSIPRNMGCVHWRVGSSREEWSQYRRKINSVSAGKRFFINFIL
jgi:hypothetical protein